MSFGARAAFIAATRPSASPWRQAQQLALHRQSRLPVARLGRRDLAEDVRDRLRHQIVVSA
jgi:hypothetical protein